MVSLRSLRGTLNLLTEQEASPLCSTLTGFSTEACFLKVLETFLAQNQMFKSKSQESKRGTPS